MTLSTFYLTTPGQELFVSTVVLISKKRLSMFHLSTPQDPEIQLQRLLTTLRTYFLNHIKSLLTVVVFNGRLFLPITTGYTRQDYDWSP